MIIAPPASRPTSIAANVLRDPMLSNGAGASCSTTIASSTSSAIRISALSHPIATRSRPGLPTSGSVRFRGGSLDRKEGFSFTRYLDFLETIDLRGPNLHHRLQFHRVERIKPPDRVINISRQDLLEELNRLEELRGMPSTDFAIFGPVLQTEEKRRAEVTPFADTT